MEIVTNLPELDQIRLRKEIGVSRNSGTPKCMVYNGKPY